MDHMLMCEQQVSFFFAILKCLLLITVSYIWMKMKDLGHYISLTNYTNILQIYMTN